MRNHLDNIWHVYQQCLTGSQQAGRCIYFVNGVKGLRRSPESVALPARWPPAPGPRCRRCLAHPAWYLDAHLEAFPEGWGGEQAPGWGRTGRRGPRQAQPGGRAESGLFTWSPGPGIAPPSPPRPPHRLSAVPPAGQVGLGWPRAELFSPLPSSPAPLSMALRVHLDPARPLPRKTKKMIS